MTAVCLSVGWVKLVSTRSFGQCRQQPPGRGHPARLRRRSARPARTPGRRAGPCARTRAGSRRSRSARSENASSTSSGSMWARPNDRIPGVSITQPPPGSGSATDWVEVCLPLPTPDTAPMARSAWGTRRFTNVDLPTPEWPEQHGDVPGQQRLAPASSGSSRPAVTTVRSRSANCSANGCRGRQVGLGQAQDGPEAAGVGGDQRAVHQSGARRRVGQRHHHQQLVGVGHHHPFGGVGVIGGAAQHRSPLAAPHDAGQGVGPAGQVAHHVDLVADDDRGAAQFAGPHRGHRPLRIAAEHAAPAAAVDGDHHRRHRRRRARAGSWCAAASRGPTGS